MAGLRPHTREFDDAARRRLGVAVTRAREAAGYSARPAFQVAAGVGKTSLFYLENGDPVGPAVYEAVARALPGWTEDTPVRILEGGEPPPTATQGAAESEEDNEEPGNAESPDSMKAGDESEPDTSSEATRQETIKLLEQAIDTAQELLERLQKRQRDAG